MGEKILQKAKIGYNFFCERKEQNDRILVPWSSLIKALNLRFLNKSVPVTFLVFPLAVQMNFHSQHPREIRRNSPEDSNSMYDMV